MRISKNNKALSALIIVLLVVGIVVIAIGAVFVFLWVSPGNLKTENMDFSGFSYVEAGSAFQVNITQSDNFSVKISAGENIFDRIQITLEGQTLKIHINPGIFFGTLNAKAEITMPTLNSLDIAGATHGTVDGFNNSDQFVAKVSGASFLELTNFMVADVDFELSGFSHLTGSGTGNNLTSTVSGGSNLDLTNFQVDNANVDLSGGSHATVKLDGRLDVQASGASSLEYIGEPTLGTINTSGASSINKR